MSARKRQFTQQTVQHIRQYLKQHLGDLNILRTKFVPLDDATRVYEHGVRVEIGIGDEITLDEVRTWVEQTYGYKQYGQYYSDRWHLSNTTFWFKYKRDRMLFLLRWGT